MLSFVDNEYIENDNLLDHVDDNGASEVAELEPLSLDFNETQARQITDAIRSAATATYILLAKAYEKKAHKALGYDTWEDYVNTEFDMSRARSYQLLNLNRVVQVIESATPEGTEIKLTEAQARDIKRELPRITERIEQETSDLTPEEASERANEIVEEERALKKEEDRVKREKEEALAQAEEDGYHRGLEEAADALLQQADGDAQRLEDPTGSVDDEQPEEAPASAKDGMRLYNFVNFANSLESMGSASDFVDSIPDGKFGEFYDITLKVLQWYQDVVDEMESRK